MRQKGEIHHLLSAYSVLDKVKMAFAHSLKVLCTPKLIDQWEGFLALLFSVVWILSVPQRSMC
jgi:hypothetical protein